MQLDTDRVRRLVAFYPVFEGYAPERRLFAERIPPPPQEPGGTTYFYPDRYDYPPALQHYRDVLYHDGWLHVAYDQHEGFEFMDRPGLIHDANFDTVTRVLCSLKASEYWGGATTYKETVENGLLPGALVRLAKLADVELPRAYEFPGAYGPNEREGSDRA